MNDKKLSMLFEWIRPIGFFIILFIGYSLGKDAVSQFHIIGPFVVMLISGTVAFENLIMPLIVGQAGAEKLGYTPDRAFEIQSGLANFATAVTALLVFILDWGRFADATIVTVMLLFFRSRLLITLQQPSSEGIRVMSI